MAGMSNFNFIKNERTPYPLKLKKRQDRGFRQHPSSFFKRHCLGKFTSPCPKNIAEALSIDEKALKLFQASALSIDAEFANKLGKNTKIGAATWLELQRQYDCYLNTKPTLR